MTVNELLKVLKGGCPYVRIIDDSKVKYHNRPDEGVLMCSFLDDHFPETWDPYRDKQVVKFICNHEVHHPQYKELGLFPPFRPDLTCEYVFKDIKQKTYYDIFINMEDGDGAN